MASPAWPNEVPVFTAGDVRKYGQDELDPKDGKGCALQLAGRVLRPGNGKRNLEAFKIYLKVLRDVAGLSDHDSVATWNDKEASKADIARCLNKAFAELGYTEPA